MHKEEGHRQMAPNMEDGGREGGRQGWDGGFGGVWHLLKSLHFVSMVCTVSPTKPPEYAFRTCPGKAWSGWQASRHSSLLLTCCMCAIRCHTYSRNHLLLKEEFHSADALRRLQRIQNCALIRPSCAILCKGRLAAQKLQASGTR